MTGLEAWVLATTVATAAPPAEPELPPAELLEFIGEWTEDEARLIEEHPVAARAGAEAARPGKEVKHETGN